MAPHPDHRWRWLFRLFLIAILAWWVWSTASSWDGSMYWSSAWKAYSANPTLFAPLLTFAGIVVATSVALGQLWIARRRHEAQTEADLQRRITESFLKAVEQLGSDSTGLRLYRAARSGVRAGRWFGPSELAAALPAPVCGGARDR